MRYGGMNLADLGANARGGLGFISASMKTLSRTCRGGRERPRPPCAKSTRLGRHLFRPRTSIAISGLGEQAIPTISQSQPFQIELDVHQLAKPAHVVLMWRQSSRRCTVIPSAPPMRFDRSPYRVGPCARRA
jgi:hypothetical protein